MFFLTRIESAPLEEKDVGAPLSYDFGFFSGDAIQNLAKVGSTGKARRGARGRGRVR